MSPAPLAPPGPAPSEGRWFWLVATYLASGLPYGLLRGTVNTHLARVNVRKEEVGLLALLFLPWALKFLWAPWIDRHVSRRTWIVGCLLALAGATLLYAVGVADLPVVEVAKGAKPPPGASLPLLGWALVLVVAALSASQDVAIDARAVETFPGRDVALSTGVRTGAYRVAIAIAGAALVPLAGPLGWQGVFLLAAGLLAALGVLSLALPPAPRVPLPPMPLREPLARLWRREGFAGIATFVVLYKMGDALLGAMGPQFLARAPGEGGLGWTDAQMGAANLLGILAAILGGLLGGWWTKRWGVVRALLVLGGAQALSNLVYAGAAAAPSDAAGWAAVLAENLTAGLGSAPFVALLMLSCDRGLAGPQYALLSSLFAAAGALGNAGSGFGVSALGWAAYFAWTFVAALPALLLLPRVGRWLASREGAQPDAPPSA